MPYETRYHHQRRHYNDHVHHAHGHLLDLIVRAYTHIDDLYEEQLHLIALVAALAFGLSLPCGIYKLPADLIQGDGWNHLLIIDFPSGQISFPVDDQHLSYFWAVPFYRGYFQGFSSKQDQYMIMLHPRLPWTNEETQPMSAIPFSSQSGEVARLFPYPHHKAKKK